MHQKERLLPIQVSARSFPKYRSDYVCPLLRESDLECAHSWKVRQVGVAAFCLASVVMAL